MLCFFFYSSSDYRDGDSMKMVKPYLLLIIIIVIDVVLFLNDTTTGKQILQVTAQNFIQMLSVLPPIFLLIGLLDVWVPRETIIKFLGENSGIKGVFLSIFMGVAAAGPLYAAFPVAGIMMKKGARFTNVLIFLGAWSTMKIPMFLFEITSLGAKFAVTRWLLSLVGILIIAWLIDKLIGNKEKHAIYAKHTDNLGSQT